MSNRKPRVEFYWALQNGEHRVNWRLIAANGEVICQCTQGFRDKHAAMENVHLAGHMLSNVGSTLLDNAPRIVGPGKPS